ncbi:hypothetical protein EF879_01675 [Micromonospora sp. HM5-17]|jgi:hypothetical protein|nr:hypothetical protein EF879_01675 [Micromonospora sp. HM5-17]
MADSTWSTPEPLPAPRRSVGRVVAMVAAALVVLAAGGVAVGFYLVGREKPTTPTVLPSTDPTKDGVPAEESPDPDLPTPSAPAAAPTTDARFVKTGQCVANEGTARRPVLVITECAPRTYEVLARFDEPTTGEEDAKAKCADVKNYTNYYFFNSDLDDLDFVLCLRQR